MPTVSPALIMGLLAILIAPAAAASTVGDRVRGDWLTEDRRGIIRIAPCGDALCGTVVGVSDWPANGEILRDVHGTPQCHLAIVRDMRPGDDERLHGTVTNPEDGRTYSAELWVGDDGVLRLRGYVGISLFGSTQHWPPFQGHVKPDCHFTPTPR